MTYLLWILAGSGMLIIICHIIMFIYNLWGLFGDVEQAKYSIRGFQGDVSNLDVRITKLEVKGKK